MVPWTLSAARQRLKLSPFSDRHYVTGFTSSNHFPTTTGGYQTAYGGGSSDAFVAKLSGNGSLLYSTYLGLSYGDQGDDIAVDSAGCAYVAGSSSGDALIAKLSANGAQLLYQTYLGGMDRDEAHGIALDASGNIYVVGTTYSGDFPTKNAFQPSLGGTPYYGCPPNCPYSDAFVAKIDPAQAYQNQIVYSTYLGGSAWDVGLSIAVDSNGNAYVTGEGESGDFPTTPGAFKTTGSIAGAGFVTKLSADGSQLVYSTYLSAPGQVHGNGIAVDASGIAYVTGSAASNNFPTTSDALKTSNMDFSLLAFSTKLSADGSTLLYSTCLGGNISGNRGNGIAVDAAGNVYVTGETAANDFPTRLDSFQPHFSGGAYTREAFIVKLSPGEPDRTPPNILMIHPQENQAGVDVTSAPLTIRILITDNGPNDTGVYWNPDDPQWSIILQSGNFLIDPDKFSYDKATGMLTYVDDDGYFPAGQCHTGYVEARDMMRNVAVKWFYFNTADPADPNSAGNDVYLCPHPDWSAAPAPMMKSAAAAAGSGSRPSCPPDTDGDGLIDTTETAATHTTTTRGTLYIKPTLKDGSSLSYWADFKQTHWAAVSVPFNKLGIELVVVGDPSAPAGSNYCSPNYTCLSNWEYDPYLDPTPPPISFVEVIYDITPQPLDSTTQAPIQTHTNFNGTARTWYWGLLGMTPYEATTNTNKDKYGYFVFVR
jgi:hypothetical protein